MSELTKQALENDMDLAVVNEPTEDNQVEVQLDLKEARKLQWKNAIESELQLLIIEAAKIRKSITEAKTQYKKDFYGKKFKKINAQVLQYVGALQRLGTPILPEGTDNGTESVTTD